MLLKPLDMLPSHAIRRSTHAKDDMVFRQGELTRGLFFVQSGQINLRRFTEAGHVITVHRATQGTLFAEASLFSDQYHCDAQCITTSVVVNIDKRTILKRMSDDSVFSQEFYECLASQLQTYRQTMEILAIKSAKERTLAAVAAGYLTGSIIELSSQIGLTHEACYRALRSQTNDGVLVQAGRGEYALWHSSS